VVNLLPEEDKKFRKLSVFKVVPGIVILLGLALVLVWNLI